MDIRTAADPLAWDDFTNRQSWAPFLQSWTMGEVYKDIGEEPIRVEARDFSGVRGICFGHIVAARRGKHLSIPYGPLLDDHLSPEEKCRLLPTLMEAVSKKAQEAGCCFLRMSPLWSKEEGSGLRNALAVAGSRTVDSPLHLLAEHIWFVPLQKNGVQVSKEELRAAMRKTTRNLIGRAERDGVSVTASKDPVKDLHHFITLHDETRRRHGFTPYTNAFFKQQVEHFHVRRECTLYLAWYEGGVIASSIHMHAFGETSYHHGASSSAHHKIPASYLLQWTAIRDALDRGDRMYNFWGIAPITTSEGSNAKSVEKGHPFAGVTLFKTGFGGEVRNIMHCIDIPLSSRYWLTYLFEKFRKWRRGF
jgi:lipid II:glycine glycyltransferase (peptidoglycan interpeptide bridge formation enzyme)